MPLKKRLLADVQFTRPTSPLRPVVCAVALIAAAFAGTVSAQNFPITPGQRATADQVAQKRARSEVPRAAIDASPALKDALEAIASGVFSTDDPNRYRDLVGGLYDHDWFMVARDFDAYAAAQRRVDEIWSTPSKWYAMAIRNTAHVGWFSSDRTIRQYAEDIWKVPLQSK